ncbi:MAG: lipid-A-disaccharide synthase-related protein [Candidatus Margulisbacteria bacterium]|nr:lipid-A-disaccharide synthase-related protein [Candidatus Margulisiibacteriota bacterium]
MDPLKIMFISNGKGEDSIACTILRELIKISQEEKTPEIKIKVLPLVGQGRAYERLAVEVVANWKELPSGGFGGQRVSSLIKDIYSGLLKITKEQIEVLNNESATVHLVVCVGDLYPVALTAFFTNKPSVHIATAISCYFHKYNLLERWLFNKYCRLVIARDELTAKYLQQHRVKSVFFGNPMMDDPSLALKGINYLPDNKRLIVLAPSSREDAYENIMRMLKVIQETGNRPSLEWIIAWAPNLMPERLKQVMKKNDWEIFWQAPNAKGFIGEARRTGVNPVKIVAANFGDLINSANVVIGMTGTGNEQVVGMGKPVFLLRGQGVNSTWRRILQYRKLLGESISIAWGSNKKIAKALVKMINNPKKLKRMAEEGQARMGGTGGAYGIARSIYMEAMRSYHA